MSHLIRVPPRSSREDVAVDLSVAREVGIRPRDGEPYYATVVARPKGGVAKVRPWGCMHGHDLRLDDVLAVVVVADVSAAIVRQVEEAQRVRFGR